MFPKYMVVCTKTVPATQTTVEKSTVLESRPADTDEQAEGLKTMLLSKFIATANADTAGNTNANQFGEGAATVQVALYTQVGNGSRK